MTHAELVKIALRRLHLRGVLPMIYDNPYLTEEEPTECRSTSTAQGAGNP